MEKKISLKNNLNKKIVGLLDLPKGKPPFPAVILCHGFKGFKEQAHLKSMAKDLAKSGIAVLRFDFTNGLGESAGTLEDISFAQGLKDIRSVVDYLCRQKFIDKEKIGLAGHSLGGQLALHYAARDRRIKVVADLAGVVAWGRNEISLEKAVRRHLKEVIKHRYYTLYSKSRNQSYNVNTKFFLELLKLSSTDFISRLKQPVIIIHGSRDEQVSLSQPRLCYKLLKSQKSLNIIPGAAHTWSEPKYFRKINPLTVSWFKKYL